MELPKQSIMSTPGDQSSTLIVYGVPPRMKLLDSQGRAIGQTFELTRSNRGTFEPALRRALAEFLGQPIALQHASMTFIKSATDLTRVVRASGARRLIYYGHALRDGQGLLPSIGHAIEPWKLADILKDSAVTEFDILGCESMSIAAKLSLDLPKIRIAYLRAQREDNVEVDKHSGRVKSLHIEDQPLYDFPRRVR